MSASVKAFRAFRPSASADPNNGNGENQRTNFDVSKSTIYRLGHTDTLGFHYYIQRGDTWFMQKRLCKGLNRTVIWQSVHAGHLAHTNVVDGPTRLNVTAKEPMRFLLWTGRPLRQPVVAHGPFVMDTEEQIAEAFADYRAGLFGSIPT